MKKKKITKKEKAKKAAAIKIIKKVLKMYQDNFKYLSEKTKGIPLKGVSTKALHTILGTKGKQKPKDCKHCHSFNNVKNIKGKTLCEECAKIPICPTCTIMLGYWGPNKDTGIIELQYDAYNKPSTEDPTMCQSCYDNNAKIPIRCDFGIARPRLID